MALLKLFMAMPFARRVTLHWHLVIGGPVYFATLRTACRLGLFRLLKQRPGLELREIATALGIDEYPARVLLLTCAAIGLVSRRGSRYRCRRIPSKLFDQESPSSITPLVEWMHHIAYRPMFLYETAIREGRPAGLDVFAGDGTNLYARLSADAELERIFHAGMATRAAEGSAALAASVRFDDFSPVLDVGGGTGHNLTAIAGRHPRVTGTLIDYPTVTGRAATTFAAAGLTDRLEARGVDFLAESFPSGYACVLLAHLTPIFAPAVNRRLLEQAWGALEPGGIVCVYGPLMDDTETGGLASAILSPYFLCVVNGQGRHYTRGETCEWLRLAGFEEIEHRQVSLNDHLVVGRKPR